MQKYKKGLQEEVPISINKNLISTYLDPQIALQKRRHNQEYPIFIENKLFSSIQRKISAKSNMGALVDRL